MPLAVLIGALLLLPGSSRAARPRAGVLPATVSLLTASPGTIRFSATNPSLGTVSGNSPATVTWTSSGGLTQNTWTLTVQSGSPTFTSCSTVPVSAVTVQCTSAGVSGGGGTGACGGSFGLSTSAQNVAGGAQGSGTQSYTVNINFTLAESWRYIASLSPECTLTLTYTVNAP
jgi:hypothetical protein